MLSKGVTGSDLHLKRIVLAAVLRSDWAEHGETIQGSYNDSCKKQEWLRPCRQWRRMREVTRFGTQLQGRTPGARERYL